MTHRRPNHRYELQEEETAYQGFARLLKYRLRHTLFKGGWSSPMTRELLVRPDAVAVLLHDPEEDVVVLVEQFRVGAVHSDNPWLLELVAGVIEPGEDPELVARREAEEEAGVSVGSVTPIARYYSSAGATSEQTYVYYARVDAHGVEGVHGLAEEHEDILVHKVPVATFLTMLNDGQLNTASLVVAAQWFLTQKA